MFKESVLIMDEVDMILHPMKSELNFPIGPKVELDLSPQRWLMPIHILDAIFFCERKRMSVSFKQSTRAMKILKRINKVVAQGYRIRALQRHPHIVLLNLDWYFLKLVPVMADWLYLWLEAQHLAGLSESKVIKYVRISFFWGKIFPLFLFFINLGKFWPFFRYLIEGANHYHNRELAFEVESKLTPNHKKMLNLSRDWLLSYLPHVLQKIDRVSFGIMNEDDYKRAIREV